MQPQPKHLSPWIAWSLLVLVIGVASFFVWNYYTDATTAWDNSVFSSFVPKHKSTSTTTTTTTATTPATTNLTYTNSTYGFTLTFPSTWHGYKMKEVVLTGELKTFYIEVPTTDTSATGSSTADAGYFSPFAISVYTPAQWQEVVNAEGPHDTLITQNSNYVFGWSRSNGIPPSDFTMSADIATIIASFKLQ